MIVYFPENKSLKIKREIIFPSLKRDREKFTEDVKIFALWEGLLRKSKPMNKISEQESVREGAYQNVYDDSWLDKQDILTRLHINTRTLQKWRSMVYFFKRTISRDLDTR